mmetsp:Transcript_52513/g.139893  ORF Transcript_52513/g.139893 Transcript_52513/m.139893 type:complete len:1120 (+) Transcript_52513:133-3492(+)
MARAEYGTQQTPYCLCCLVAAAIAAQTLVLYGNICTAEMMETLGDSTSGWSNVGITLADSLSDELDEAMSSVATVMTDTITSISDFEEVIDTALGILGQLADSVTDNVSTSLLQGYKKRYASMYQRKEKHISAVQTALSAYSNATAASSAFPNGSLGVPAQEKDLVGGVPAALARQAARVSPHLSLEKLPQEVQRTLQRVAGPSLAQQGSRIRGIDITDLENDITDISALLNDMGITENVTVDNVDEISHQIKAQITQVVYTLEAELVEKLYEFWDIILPGLYQLQTWITTFGDSIQGILDSFTVTIDMVQKIFDQIMAQLSTSGGDNKLGMVWETYNLFDMNEDSFVNISEMEAVAELYSISQLQGSTASSLVLKYDENGDGQLCQGEFWNMVDDSQVDMSVLLRTYADKLSTIAGNIGSAYMRCEVSEQVVNYLKLVCAKNMTKVGWVSNALTNKSLPTAFTADILVELADQKFDENVYTTTDTSLTVITEMISLEPEYVMECFRMVQGADFWDEEGWDSYYQPTWVGYLVDWFVLAFESLGITDIDITDYIYDNFTDAAVYHRTKDELVNSEDSTATIPSNLMSLSDEEARSLPKRARYIRSYAQFVQLIRGNAQSLLQVRDSSNLSMQSMSLSELARQTTKHTLKRHKATSHRRQKRAAIMERYSSGGASRLKHRLLGGVAASSSTTDPTLDQTVNSGVPAHPETLLFAAYLESNASGTADRLQSMCFQWSQESSSTLNSFANKVSVMADGIVTVVELMYDYATEEGIATIEEQMANFTESAATDMIEGIMEYINDKLESIVEQADDQALDSLSLLDAGMASHIRSVNKAHRTARRTSKEKVKVQLSTTWTSLVTLLDAIQLQIPGVVTDMTSARTEVSSVASNLISIFTTFEDVGPDILTTISTLYKELWIFYWVLWMVLTTSTLFYGLWACGWFGGPKSTDEALEYQPPRTFRERCWVCCDSCMSCCRSCHDSHIVFWSVILIVQVIVLILFIVSILLCFLAGVQAFLSAGCTEIYMLTDNTVCTGILTGIQDFLSSFWATSSIDINDACESTELLTCSLISDDLTQSMYTTTIGSMLAALITFQLLIESAMMHERARFTLMYKDEVRQIRGT